MLRISRRRRSLWRLWGISAIWREKGQCPDRRDRPQPKRSTLFSMRLVLLRMSMFSRSSFPQRRPSTNASSKNQHKCNTRNRQLRQSLQCHQRTRINWKSLLRNSASPLNKRAKWVRRQSQTLRLQSRQRRRSAVDLFMMACIFRRLQDQIFGFSPRYFYRQRTAFLILSFLRMLQEHSTFIPFAYSQKGRVWQLGGGAWQQLHRHPQSVLANVKSRYSVMATMEMAMQMGRYSSICSWYMPKLQVDASEPVSRLTSEAILVLAMSIHSPNNGQTMRQIVRMVDVREVKSYPSPSMRTELFCSRERVVTYLLKMLMSPSGSRTGTPAEKSRTVMTTKNRSELSLQASTEYFVISLFIFFCRILPSLFSRCDLLAKQHLSNKKKTQIRITSRMSELVKMGDTLRYQTLVKLGQKEMLLTCRKFLKSDEITVMKETQLLAVKPKMSPQMSMGTQIELRKMKMVQMAVFAQRADPSEAGRTHPMSLSTTSPKRKLVRVAVIITTYWMDCSMQIPVRQSAHAVLMVESANESMRFALQQHCMMRVLPEAVAVAAVQEEMFSPSQLLEWEEMQILQIPIMQQLTSRNTTITKKAAHPRRNLPQGVIQKWSQFISSGAGTFSLLTSSLFPLKDTLSVTSGTQQQQSVLQQACEHLAYWQCCLNSSKHSFLDFSNWKWTKADWVVG